MRNAHATFKSDLCTNCPASAKLPLVGERRTDTNNTGAAKRRRRSITSMRPRRGNNSSASRTSIDMLPENTDVSLAAKESRANAVYLECGHSHRCWNCAMEKSHRTDVNTDSTSNHNSSSSSSSNNNNNNSDSVSTSLPSIRIPFNRSFSQGVGSNSRGRSAARLEVAKRKEEASVGPIGECGICGHVGQIARAKDTFNCPVCFDSVSTENAFCAGTCGEYNTFLKHVG